MDVNITIVSIYCAVAVISSIVMFYVARVVMTTHSKYSIYAFVVFSIITAGIAAIFDCAYILRENSFTDFPEWVNYLLTVIYVINMNLTGTFWIFYSEKKQKSFLVSSNKRFIIYAIPFAIYLLICLTTPFTHWYFYFDDNQYQRGPLFAVVSLLMLFYLVINGVAALIRSFKKENYVDRTEYRRLFFFAVVYLAIQIVQLNLQNVFPYRSVGTMLVFVFFLIQNLRESLGHDALTHISNRFEAERQLHDVLSNKEHYEIVLLDGDKFKNINDKYGHQEGDKALQYLAEAISVSVDRTCFIARMGGDEFILINKDPNYTLVGVEEKINTHLADILKNCIKEYKFTVSCGYALKDDSVNSVPDLIKLADKKLYERKGQKK